MFNIIVNWIYTKNKHVIIRRLETNISYIILGIGINAIMALHMHKEYKTVFLLKYYSKKNLLPICYNKKNNYQDTIK